MRNLTNISSAAHFTPRMWLKLTSRDRAATFVHCHDDFIAMDAIEWEMPFTGGLGKPGNYNVSLSLPIDTVKERMAAYNRAEATLRVDVAGASFYPHVGRVRALRRDGMDLNQVTLTIVDRLFDDNPKVPVEAIVDSYSGAHPEELAVDAGYPLYYGDESQRNFYHTAIDCDLQQLLGPRNVSSISHTSSQYFNFRLGPDDVTLDNIFLLKKTWGQQSGGTNLVSGGHPLEVGDISANDHRLIFLTSDVKSFRGVATRIDDQVFSCRPIEFSEPDCASLFNFRCKPEFALNSDIKNSVFNLTRFEGTLTFSGIGYYGSQWNMNFEMEVGSYEPNVPFTVHTVESYYFSLDSNSDPMVRNFDRDVSSSPEFNVFSYQNNRLKTWFRMVLGRFDGPSRIESCGFARLGLMTSAQLMASAYNRYSVYSFRSDSSYIAISENPIAILDDVFSHHTFTPYVQDQSSAAQADCASYQFHCLFAERRPLVEIADEVGRICRVNLWLGDSGMVNFRTYQGSGAATVNRTLAPEDFLLESFSLEESPIGSTLHEQELAREVTVEFGFHFQRDQYEKNLRAFPGNTAMCNSMEAVGVKNAVSKKSEYILASDTASLYLANLVRKHCQGNEFVSFAGGPNLFDLELADVVKVQHPMIVGSEALYQIIRAELNPLEGRAAFTAAKLIAYQS